MAYRLEYAASGRAACKAPPPCKGTKIEKGALRFGTVVEIQNHTTFHWRHWGCVTKKQVSNIQDKIGDAEDIDGYEDLREEDQQRVSEAIKAGGVLAADVTPGMEEVEADGSPKKKARGGKKKAKEEGDVDGEGAETEPEGSPRKKPTPKPRGGRRKKVKPEEEEEDGEEEEAEFQGDESEEEIPKPKARGKKVKDEDEFEGEETKPTSTTTSKKERKPRKSKDKVKAEDLQESLTDEEEDEKPAPLPKAKAKPNGRKCARASDQANGTSVKIEDYEEPSSSSAAAAPPQSKRKRSIKWEPASIQNGGTSQSVQKTNGRRKTG